MRLALLQAVHIGDSLTTDIAGGNNVGLKATIWVNRRGLPLPEGAAKPTHTVRHVTELAGALTSDVWTAAGDCLTRSWLPHVSARLWYVVLQKHCRL